MDYGAFCFSMQGLFYTGVRDTGGRKSDKGMSKNDLVYTYDFRFVRRKRTGTF